MANSRRIGVFGAGWVGLVTGGCLAELGHEVVVRDVVPERIEALRSGQVPFHEPELADVLARNRERLHYTLDVDDVASADILFVCVQTPPTYSGDADLLYVWNALDELPRADRHQILVMKSTVPVGTGEKVRAALDARDLTNVGYVSNPEFLAEGRAVRDFLNPDRIVIGAFDHDDAAAVEELYTGLAAAVVRTDVASAEMIKLAANAFLMTRISFINEIANVCEAVGADVVQVAKGIGLDHRLGPHFLRAGIGYGGSCLAGDETVLARARGRAWLTSLRTLFDDLSGDRYGEHVLVPRDLEVLAWRADASEPEFLPVAAATRRPHRGELLEVQTKMGRRVRCTPDHPFVVTDAEGSAIDIKLADELTDRDWLPVAQGAPQPAAGASARPPVLAGMSTAALEPQDIVVRAAPEALERVGIPRLVPALQIDGHERAAERAHQLGRSRTLRPHEAERLDLDRNEALDGTAEHGRFVPGSIVTDETFWYVVGLYLAKGDTTSAAGWYRIMWSFHPRDEFDLVESLMRFWPEHGINARLSMTPTTAYVIVQSKLLVGWWLGSLGLGATCYDQRLPDLAWTAPESHKRALLEGLWRGDGSWSFRNRGPSDVLEYGTVSPELADGILRLLAEFGIVARLKVGRAARSTCDTYWLSVSGSDQVESLLDLVTEGDHDPIRASSRRQSKRIAPPGYRRHHAHAAWVRVTDVKRRPFSGDVYSLEVPGAHTFVTTGGLIVDNCFPKDSLALKQLASNSGYHFQLLSAVIEVNELQKRRVISKLQKHLGKLRGKKVALLGLAFKAGTDDMREAPSIVLASRLLAEGAEVRAWDPVANPGELLKGAQLCETVLEAVRDADAAVIVTEWDELRDLASPETREAMARPLIVDGRNLLDPDATRAAGFAYEGIGRPSSPFGSLPEIAEPAARPPVRESGPVEAVWESREVPPAGARPAQE